jgi:small nuclear ribonucleoprotein (snRNP)-like protein
LTNAFKVKEQYFKNIGKEVIIKKNDGKKISGILRDLLLNDDVILDVKKKIKNTKNYSIQEVIVALSEIKETKLKINFK